MITKTGYNGDALISYKNDQDIKDKIYDKIIEWCFKENIFLEEVFMQSDDGVIEAPVLLSNIIDDIIKFKVDWIGE